MPDKPTKSALADALGISRQMVYKAAARGMPVDSIEAARAWRREQQPDSRDGRSSVTDETARLRKAQADLTELEADERRGELTPVDDVQIALNEAMVIVSTQLEALPGRCAATLAPMTDAGEIRAYLLDEVRKVRSAAASRLEDWARAVERGAAPEAAAKPDSGPVGGSVSDPAAGES